MPQLLMRSAFTQGRGDVLGSASHLVDPVRQGRRLVGGEHHRVWCQRGRLPAADQGALLVGALSAGLPAVLPPPPDPSISHVAATPSARLGAGTAWHVCTP